MNKIRISYILPVYNVKPYLSDCIDSLLDQGLSDDEYEIICVNDGSTDDSDILLNKYANMNKSLIVVNQTNQGVSAARNRGLELSSGDLVWFIDPDDFILSNIAPYIIECFINYNCEIVKVEKTIVAESDHYSHKEVEFNVGDNIDQTATVWQYIVRRDSLRNSSITFDEELSYGEDYLWECLVRQYLKNIVSISTPIYHYRKRVGSAMSTSSNMSKIVKHKDDMSKLAIKYKSLSITMKNIDLNFSNHLSERAELSAKAVLLDSIRVSTSKQDLLNDISLLRSYGLYPYRFHFLNIFKNKSLKSTALSLYEFLLPSSRYVMLLWRIHNALCRIGE